MAANRTSASPKPPAAAAKKTKNTTSTKTKKTKTTPIQNESTRPQTPPKDQLDNPSSSTSKRTKSPGVRLIGSRIYDSKNGKTCHQCRQKTMDFSVTCTNQSENKRKCTLNVCQACLLNRYGENAEEAAALGDWKCPRCRGICNCSFCMKKKGWNPTGVLVHTAKKKGYASVSNLLNVNGSTATAIVQGGARKKRSASDKENRDEPERKLMKEDHGASVEEKNMIEAHNVEIQLPNGTELTNLAGIDVPSEDIGHALQLLEFCETFGEVFELKKGDSEILLCELTCANANKGHEPLVVQFHTKLLSLIEEDSGKKYSGKSWVEDLKECICESQYSLKESLLEFFDLQHSGYDELSLMAKLKLLNFLCEEALGTVKLRLWIEERNVEEKKKAKEKLIANREKEKNMKKKVQDEVAKAILSQNGTPLTISEQKDLVLKIKAETAQTLANSSELRELRGESYVVRSEPLLLDIDGCKLWKLRSCSNGLGILLQDSCYGDEIFSNEKWFAYNDQEKALVDKYISTSRNFRE